MKTTLLFIILCSTAVYSEIQIAEDFQLGDAVELDSFENELAGMLKGIFSGEIGASNAVILNGFVDRMFIHLRNIVAKDGFNTIPLPDESFKAKHAAHGSVHDGSLSDLSTIYRTDDVIIAFDTTQKKVTLQFPFKFDELKIKYDFNAKALFFKTHGGIQGTLKNVRFNPVLSFNYQTDTFTLDHFDMKHSGEISVKFTGSKLVDWLLDALSKLVTSIMHNHIVNKMQNEVGSVIQKLIVKLNVDIHKKLHPTL